ncbi:MAG: type IX secretion system outer membrane channel protein PorV [Bacteroidetes bacterium]|nr:type IX secretion system outer membrane channel protein PorV [Bacteroidota bacterium]
MKFFSLRARYILLALTLLLPSLAFCQVLGPGGTNTNGSSSTQIPTAVPFLLITPDSRSGGMGEAGVAISPDVNANFWNPSKLAFMEGDNDLSASYSPWLRNLVPDVSLSYVSYAHRLDDRNSFGASLRYFNLGTIELTDANQQSLGTYTPNEFSVDGSFARKFGNNFSLGLSLRFIHSSLANGAFLSGQQIKAANAVASDISLYYKKQLQEFGSDAEFAFGTDISNIGSKVSYTDNGTKYFLPANLKLGIANTINMDATNSITFALDFNKLLVPTPPIVDNNGNIIKGQSDDVSVPTGIFQSFTDAPNGFSQEMQEISISPGLEYWYNKVFALRAGYFYQNANNGGLHYFTFGTGLRYDIYAFDFSYIAASQQNSPLANTLRFTLMINFGSGKKQ